MFWRYCLGVGKVNRITLFLTVQHNRDFCCAVFMKNVWEKYSVGSWEIVVLVCRYETAIHAYEQPAYENIKDKDSALKKFRNMIELQCFKELYE